MTKFINIAPKNSAIPNQPWLSRRAVWLHSVASKFMDKYFTKGLGMGIYMSSFARRARKLGAGGPMETVIALMDNTKRRIIHRVMLPRAMTATQIGMVIAIVLAVYSVKWCWNHGDDVGHIYVVARGLPVMSQTEQKAGVTGQLLRKAGETGKSRILQWFKKDAPQEPEKSNQSWQ